MQQLRGLSARAPYFSNGQSKTLSEVVNFYDTRFDIRLTDQENALRSLFVGVTLHEANGEVLAVPRVSEARRLLALCGERRGSAAGMHLDHRQSCRLFGTSSQNAGIGIEP